MSQCKKCRGHISSGASVCQWCGVDDPNNNAGIGILVAVALVIGLVYSVYNWAMNNLYLVGGGVLIIVAIGVLIAAIQSRNENGGQGGCLVAIIAVVLGLVGAGAAINGYENYTEFSFEMPGSDDTTSDETEASADNASADTSDEVSLDTPAAPVEEEAVAEPEPEPATEPAEAQVDETTVTSDEYTVKADAETVTEF